MGEVYKGLTIRLGADASELKKALRASDSAINSTQKQLRELAKAAKLDPASTKVYAEKMDILGDKAVALNAKLMELKKSDFMKHLSVSTQDAALKAKYATAEYAKLCDQIKALKNSAAIDAGIDPFKKGKDPFKNIKEGSVEAVKEIRRLGKIAKKTQAEINQEVNEYLSLVRRWEKAGTSNEIAKERAELDKFKTTLAAVEVEARAAAMEMARLASANPKITQSAKFEAFRRGIERADESAKELRAEIAMLDRALDFDPYSIEAARLKFAAMNEQVRLNVAMIEEMDKQLDTMRARGLDKVAEGVVDLRQEIAKAENEVEKWGTKLSVARAHLAALDADTSVAQTSKEFKEATAEVDKFEKKLASAQRRLDKFAGAREYSSLHANMEAMKAETVGTINALRDFGDASGVTRGSLQQLGWSLYSTVTPAMMMFGSRAIQAAEDVDSGYRNMRKTVQGTEEQFESMKQAALDYSRTHVTDAATLLEIEAMGGQLGVATENLEGFATTVSNLEIATNLDADTASEQLGQLAGILNDMTQDDFAKFGDALVRLGNNNATLEDKIMDVMLRIGSMGTITGFTTTELLSWSTAVAATGQGAEAAGTAISKTMSDIESAVGKGGDSLEAFAEVAGMSSTHFAKMWNESPSDAMKAWIEGLKSIENSGGTADATLTDLGITSVRQKQAILGLMQTVDGLNANLTMSENAWNGVSDDWGAAGDAAREAERKAEGFSGAIQLLRNNMDALGVEMGESVTPFLKFLSEVLAGITQLYSDLPDPAKWFVDFALAAGAFAGPLLVGTNAVSRALSDMGEGIVNGKKALAKMAESGAETIASNEQVAKALHMTADAADGTTKKWKDMTKAEKLAALGTHTLKSAFGVLPQALGAIAVGMVISELVKFVEYAKLAEKATEGLRATADAAKNGLANVDASTYVDSAKKVIESAKAMTEANAEFADNLNDTWQGVNKDNALVGEYAKVIEELGWHSNLSATDQVRLKAAVQGLNDVCGTSYQVLDATNGVLNKGTDVILENAKAWQENAKAQAAQKAVQDIMSQMVQTEGELAIVKAKRAELDEQAASSMEYAAGAASWLAIEDARLASEESRLTAQLDEQNYSLGVFTDMAAGYVNQAGNAATATSLYSEEVTALIDGLLALSENNVFFNDLLAGSGMTVEDLAVKMDTAGISIDSLSSKMEEYATRTADAFNRIEGVSDVSLQTMLDTLQHNTEVTQNWSSNLTKLYAKAGDDSQRAFIDYIAGLGVEYAPIVQQLLDDNTGMLEELAAAWQEADSAGAGAAFVETQRAADEAAIKIEESAERSKNAFALLREGVDYEIENTDFKTSMSEKASGIPEAILEQKEPAVAAVREVEDAMVGELDGIEDRTEPYGRDFASGHATGVINGIPAGKAAVERYINEMIAAIPKTQDSHSPAKKTMPFGKDFVDGYAVGIEDETPEAVEAAEELVDDTLDMLATSESGTWVHGYHAAINYADGLASGAGAVKDAAGSLASSAADEMDAFIDGLAAQYKKAQLVAKEGDKLLTEIMWGSIYPATMKYEYKTPQTEDVYASMKVLEAAGYDLDEYIKKHDELSEKMKSGDVSDSVKAEYEKIMALSGQLTASTDKMKEWHGLYTVKNDLITGMETAEDWSDSLVSLFNKTGVVYSKEFVEAMTSGGEEYQSALRKMSGMTSSQVQEMVDSFDDLALAQREQEINARSLWVNSLPNAMVNSKEAMLDFRETCLDVKEAIYSDRGLMRAFELTGTEVVNLALDLESLDITMADFASMAQGYASQVANGFQAMTTYNQTGLYEWERNLKANIVSAQQWADNVNAVFDSIDPSIDSEAFRQAVLNEGFDVWGQVMADMATMPPERIGEYVALYNEALTTGMMSAYETMDAIAPGDELLQATIEGIAGLTPELEGQAKDAALKGAGAALATQPEWYSTGVNLASGIASGIQSQIGAIAAAAAATVRAAIEAAKAEAAIASPSKVMRDEVGYMLGMGMAVGMDKAQAKVALASTLAVETAVNAAKRSIALNGVSAQVAAANGFAAARAASVTNNSTTNDNRSYSSPVTVSIQATIREDADITKLAKEINRVQQRALRAGGNA